MEYVPTDILVNIFSFLTKKELCNCSLACKEWHIASVQEVLWKPIFENSITFYEQRADIYEESVLPSNKKRLKFTETGVEGIDSFRSSLKEMNRDLLFRKKHMERMKQRGRYADSLETAENGFKTICNVIRFWLLFLGNYRVFIKHKLFPSLDLKYIIGRENVDFGWKMIEGTLIVYFLVELYYHIRWSFEECVMNRKERKKSRYTRGVSATRVWASVGFFASVITAHLKMIDILSVGWWAPFSIAILAVLGMWLGGLWYLRTEGELTQGAIAIFINSSALCVPVLISLSLWAAKLQGWISWGWWVVVLPPMPVELVVASLFMLAVVKAFGQGDILSQLQSDASDHSHHSDSSVNSQNNNNNTLNNNFDHQSYYYGNINSDQQNQNDDNIKYRILSKDAEIIIKDVLFLICASSVILTQFVFLMLSFERHSILMGLLFGTVLVSWFGSFLLSAVIQSWDIGLQWLESFGIDALSIHRLVQFKRR